MEENRIHIYHKPNYESDENKKDITMETKDVKYWSETYKNQSRINKKRMNKKRTSEKRSNEKKESVY